MIDYVYKDLFTRSDTRKELLIYFDEGTITNHEMHQGSFSLEESLCSEPSLVFGTCESSVLKFKVHNIFTDLKNKWLEVSLILNGDTSNPFQIGRFKVVSDVPTGDRKKRDVTAYDALHDIINSDVAEWYNRILPNENSTVTMKQFRSSFFSHFEIEEADIELVNDSMAIAKTIQPEELSGKTVINAICEINGCFGHIGRDGKFHYVYLAPIIEGIYPANDLFPTNDLFPVQPNTEFIGKGAYIPPCTYEAYKVQAITGLQIRKEENDVGVTVGTKDNLYVIEDNILVYGKSTSDLTAIANNILEKIQKLVYRPFNTKAVGNPCIEVSDPVRLNTKTQKIESYVLHRTLTGVKSMRDTYTADGSEYLPKTSNSISKQIIELKGKSNTLTRTLEETKSEIKDVEQGLTSTITQTAKEIRAEVSDVKNGLNSKIEINSEAITAEVKRATKAEGDLSASIKINADEITSEVKRAKNAENVLSSVITQKVDSISLEVTNGSTSSGIKISVSKDGETQELTGKIEMTGMVAFSDLSGEGTTVINGSNITTGKVKAEFLELTGFLTIGDLQDNTAQISPYSISCFEGNFGTLAVDGITFTPKNIEVVDKDGNASNYLVLVAGLS